MADLIQIRTPKPAPKPGKFKTTKRMRSICTEFRNWIVVYTATYEDDRDAGKMDAADLVAWLIKMADLEPDNLAVKLWRSLDAAEREQVKAAWLHLRGPTWEEKAIAGAQRTNARILAKNPLFAVSGAIDEVAGLTTPEQVLRNMAAGRAANRKRSTEPTVLQSVRANLDPDAVLFGKATINQARIWRYFLHYGEGRFVYLPTTDEHIEQAREQLETITGGDRAHMKRILDGIITYHANRGAIESDGIREGVARLRDLAAIVGVDLAPVVVPDVIEERVIPAMMNAKEGGQQRVRDDGLTGSLFELAA